MGRKGLLRVPIDGKATSRWEMMGMPVDGPLATIIVAVIGVIGTFPLLHLLGIFNA